MEIEKLKGSLLSEAKAEAEKTVKSAEADAKAMLSEERAKLSALKSEAEKSVEKSLEEQKNERIAWARLEAKRVLAEAKERAVADTRNCPKNRAIAKHRAPVVAARGHARTKVSRT